MDKCPLCLSYETSEYSRDQKRIYYQCSQCSLIFVPRNLLIAEKEEKLRYESHKNDALDAGYKAYLGKIADSLLPFLADDSQGLDFGSGRTTLLADLLKEKGINVESYDLFFRPDEKIWSRHYDFIVLSEVVEHLREPLETLKSLKEILTKDGQLFIKTKFYPKEKKNFENWFYKRDMTHVQFFSDSSMRFLARSLGFEGKFQMIGEDLYRIKTTLTENILTNH